MTENISSPQPPQEPGVKLDLPRPISERLATEKIVEMRSKINIELPQELTKDVIERDRCMISGLPDGDPLRNSLLAELRPIEETAEQWKRSERDSAALQAAVMVQFLKDLAAAGDDPRELEEVMRTYFEGEQPGDALLYRANALYLTANKENAETLLFRLDTKDRIAARVIDEKARRRRMDFYEEAQQVKEGLAREIETDFDRMMGEEDNAELSELTTRIAEKLRPLFARLPKDFLTRSGIENYIEARLAATKDPLRRLAFKVSSGLLKSAEEVLGCKITVDDKGEIASIEIDKEGKSNVFTQLVQTEMAIERTQDKLAALLERIEAGDISVAPEITGLGEYLREQLQLRNAIESLIEARLGVSLSSLKHPKELIGSVNGRNIVTEIADKGVIGAESALAAALTYEAAHLGGEKLHQMADELARQLQVASEQLRLLLQQAAEAGQQFVQQAQAQNIPGGDQALTQTVDYWKEVMSLERFLETAPRIQKLYEFLSTGLHAAAPWAAGIAAGISLGREKVASTVRRVTRRVTDRFIRPKETV
jgi:hypothetical protein